MYSHVVSPLAVYMGQPLIHSTVSLLATQRCSKGSGVVSTSGRVFVVVLQWLRTLRSVHTVNICFAYSLYIPCQNDLFYCGEHSYSPLTDLQNHIVFGAIFVLSTLKF